MRTGGTWSSFGNPCSVSTPSFKNYQYQDFENVQQPASTLVLFPNPSNREVTLQLTNFEFQNFNASIQVMDLTGKVLLQKNITNGSGNSLGQLNSNQILSQGIYLVRVTVEGKVYTEKLVIK